MVLKPWDWVSVAFVFLGNSGRRGKPEAAGRPATPQPEREAAEFSPQCCLSCSLAPPPPHFISLRKALHFFRVCLKHPAWCTWLLGWEWGEFWSLGKQSFILRYILYALLRPLWSPLPVQVTSGSQAALLKEVKSHLFPRRV